MPHSLIFLFISMLSLTSLIGMICLLLVSLWRARDYLSRKESFQLFGRVILHVKTQKKVVALTFDDGPNPPYTNQLVELLQTHGARATFFMIGKNIEKFPQVAALVFSKGNELANHSYSHKKLVKTSLSYIRSEIEKTDILLRRIVGSKEIHFRAPFGQKLFSLPYVLRQMGKKHVLWNLIPEPPDYERPDPHRLKESVLRQIKPGSIILLHDGQGERPETVLATEMILKELHSLGYEFRTVSELLNEASLV